MACYVPQNIFAGKRHDEIIQLIERYNPPHELYQVFKDLYDLPESTGRAMADSILKNPEYVLLAQTRGADCLGFSKVTQEDWMAVRRAYETSRGAPLINRPDIDANPDLLKSIEDDDFWMDVELALIGLSNKDRYKREYDDEPPESLSLVPAEDWKPVLEAYRNFQGQHLPAPKIAEAQQASTRTNEPPNTGTDITLP